MGIVTENVNFVDRVINPPNVLQVKPIESFWGKLDQNVYDDESKTYEQLIARIKIKLKEFDSKDLQTSMRHVKNADGGVYATFKKYFLLLFLNK